jgi:hypothetical protein
MQPNVHSYKVQNRFKVDEILIFFSHFQGMTHPKMY